MTLIDGCVLVGTTDNRLKAKRTTVKPIMNGEKPNLLSAFSYPSHPLADPVTDDATENPADSNQKRDEPSTANESNDLKNNLESEEDGWSLGEESNVEGMVLSECVDSQLSNKKLVSACKNKVSDICSKMKDIKEKMNRQANLEESHISSESENSLNCKTDKTKDPSVHFSKTSIDKTIENSCGIMLLNGASDLPVSEESSKDPSSSKKIVDNKLNKNINVSLIEVQDDTIPVSSVSLDATTQVSNKIDNTLDSNISLNIKEAVSNDQINTCANSANTSDDNVSRTVSNAGEEHTTQATDSEAIADLSFESMSEEMILQVEEDELLETDFQSTIRCVKDAKISEDSNILKTQKVESCTVDAERTLLSDVSAPGKSQPSAAAPEKSSKTEQEKVCEQETVDPADFEELLLCDNVSTQNADSEELLLCDNVSTQNAEPSNTLDEQSSKECSELSTKQMENSVSSSCSAIEQLNSENALKASNKDDDSLVSTSSSKCEIKEVEKHQMKSEVLEGKDLGAVQKSAVALSTPECKSEEDSVSSAITENGNISTPVSMANHECRITFSPKHVDGATNSDEMPKTCSNEINTRTHEVKASTKECVVEVNVNLKNNSSTETNTSHFQQSNTESNRNSSNSSEESRNSANVISAKVLENELYDKTLNNKPTKECISTNLGTEMSSTNDPPCQNSENQLISEESAGQEALKKMEVESTENDFNGQKNNSDPSKSKFSEEKESGMETSGSNVNTPEIKERSNSPPIEASEIKRPMTRSEESEMAEEDSKTESICSAGSVSSECAAGEDQKEDDTKSKVKDCLEGDTNNRKKEDESHSQCDEEISPKQQTGAKDENKDGVESKSNYMKRSQNESEDVPSVTESVKENDSSGERAEDGKNQKEDGEKISHEDPISDGSLEGIDKSCDETLCPKESETKERQDVNDTPDLKTSVSGDVAESSAEDNQEIPEDICSEELILDDFSEERETSENDFDERENDSLSDTPDSRSDTPDTDPSDDQKEESEEAEEINEDSNFGNLVEEELVPLNDIIEKEDGKKEMLNQDSEENLKESMSNSESGKNKNKVEEINAIKDSDDEVKTTSEKLTHTDDQQTDNFEVTENESSEENSSKYTPMVSEAEKKVKTNIINDSESEECNSVEDVSRKVLDSIIDLISMENNLKNDASEEMQSVPRDECESKDSPKSVFSSTNDRISHHDHLYSASPKSSTSGKRSDSFLSLKRSACDAAEDEDEAFNKRARPDEDSLSFNKRRISDSSDTTSSLDYKKMKILTDSEGSSDEADSSDSENYSIADTVRATYDSDDMKENSDSCSSFDFPPSSSEPSAAIEDDDAVVKKFSRFQASLRNVSREDLEEIIVLKMIETLKYKGIAGEQQKQLVNLQEQCATQKKQLISIKKQYSETSIIMKKFIEQSESQLKKNFIVPMKATRSVGLQVALADSPSHSSKADLIPSGTKKSANLPTKSKSPLLTTKLKTAALPVVTSSNQQDSTIKTKLANTVTPLTSPIKVTPTVKVLTPVSRPPPLQQVIAQSKPATQPTSQIITTLAQKPLTFRTKASNLEVIDLVDDSQQQARTSGIQNVQNKGTLPQNSVGQVQQLSYVVTTGGQQLLLSPPINQGARMISSTVNNRGVLGTPIKNGQIFQLQNKTGVLSGNQFHLVTNAAQLKQVIRPVMQVTPTSVKSPQIKHIPRILRPLHPAPLPTIPLQSFNPVWKLRPPKPTLRIGKNGGGITLSWTLSGYDKEKFAEIVSYQLFAYQEGTEPPNTDLWKKVGDVKALPLPMACTLTKFVSGHRYHFAVQAVDIHSRVGEYSTPDNIMLN